MSLQEKTREVLFQLLYAQDFSEGEGEARIEALMQEVKMSRRHVRDAYAKMLQVWERREALDVKIAAASREYALERISRVERNVLRLGAFELESDLPPKVALSEAVRLCRKFGTPESADFVNAVLDQILKNGVVSVQSTVCT